MTYSVTYGGKKGKKVSFEVAKDMIAIRYHQGQSFEKIIRSTQSRQEVTSLEEVAIISDAKVAVMRVPKASRVIQRRDVARNLVKSSGVRFAGRVLLDKKSKRPILYTENYFIRFTEKLSKTKCKAILKQFNLEIKLEYKHIPNTYFVAAEEGSGADKVFAIGEKLLNHESVELCHPELIREKSSRNANQNQWHLKKTKIGLSTINAHAHIEDAWDLTRGEGTTICIIDDGVDIDHQDFSGNGKVVHGWDVTLGTNDPRPKQTAIPESNFTGDAHGTACAGVACANGNFDASGVAPKSTLLPIRLASGLGSQAEHDAIIWAVEHGADVISCSWGPPDGTWYLPDDPRHDQVTPLPDSTRTALEYATTNGRNGKGCVIAWAAGNGNESVDNDGYASSEYVMAIAACSDRGKKSVYSDYGHAIWCSFPSNNFAIDGSIVPRTSGIWTTDRSDQVNQGYNPHFGGGDTEGKYTNGFGGTSSSCPGVAGVAALIISQNPNLDWAEVCNLIAETSDQIDKTGGNYDADSGHSHLYGYGRVNAKRAVKKAKSLL